MTVRVGKSQRRAVKSCLRMPSSARTSSSFRDMFHSCVRPTSLPCSTTATFQPLTCMTVKRVNVMSQQAWPSVITFNWGGKNCNAAYLQRRGHKDAEGAPAHYKVILRLSAREGRLALPLHDGRRRRGVGKLIRSHLLPCPVRGLKALDGIPWRLEAAGIRACARQNDGATSAALTPCGAAIHAIQHRDRSDRGSFQRQVLWEPAWHARTWDSAEKFSSPVTERAGYRRRSRDEYRPGARSRRRSCPASDGGHGR